MTIPARYRYSALVATCLLATGLLFIKCFGHSWTYDDTPVVLANQDIRSLANFFDNHYPGRPLRELSYWLDYTIWGFDPAGFTVQNLFWHGLCAGLLGCLLLRIGVASRWALGGALLFLSHPLTVEVAANTGHRKDSLCLAFILLAVFCHLEACQAYSRRWYWFWGAIVFFVVACLAKQHAFLTPLVWLVTELTLVPSNKRILACRLWPWSLAVGGGLFVGAAWLLLGDAMQRLQTDIAILLMKFNILDEVSLTTYYQMVGKALVFAMWKIIWPTELAPEYTFPAPAGFVDPWVLAAVAIVVIYPLIGTWLWYNKRSWLLFWLWIGIFWLPVLNLWPLVYLVADRYLYTPLVGVVALLIIISARLAERWRVIVPAIVVVLLINNTWLTWRQIDIWQSDLVLWTHVSQVNPLSASAFINLSVHAINVERDFEKGLVYAERAVFLNVKHPVAHRNYAVALERLGRDTEALREYRIAYNLYRNKRHPVAQEIRKVVAQNFGILLK